jgi:predicted protein tyrosine phosphatase
MKVHICSRTQVSRMTSRTGATHVLSLLDPGKRPHLHPRMSISNWLLIPCEDQIDAASVSPPTREQVQRFLDWSKALPEDSVLLVHCEAGISRSTAAALAIMVQDQGVDKIDACIAELLEIRPNACPNPLITQYADDILGCGGALHAAAEFVAQEKLLNFLT